MFLFSSLYRCCWMVLHLPLLLTLLHLPLAVNTSNLINGWLTKSESMGYVFWFECSYYQKAVWIFDYLFMSFYFKHITLRTLYFTIILCYVHASGTFYPGVCDIPEEAMSIYYGGSGPRQGPAQKRPAASRDLSHHAGLPAVLCWVRADLP